MPASPGLGEGIETAMAHAHEIGRDPTTIRDLVERIATLHRVPRHGIEQPEGLKALRIKISQELKLGPGGRCEVDSGTRGVGLKINRSKRRLDTRGAVMVDG